MRAFCAISFHDYLKILFDPFESFDSLFKGTIWVKEQRVYSCPHFPILELLLEYAFSLLHIDTHGR